MGSVRFQGGYLVKDHGAPREMEDAPWGIITRMKQSCHSSPCPPPESGRGRQSSSQIWGFRFSLFLFSIHVDDKQSAW